MPVSTKNSPLEIMIRNFKNTTTDLKLSYLKLRLLGVTLLQWQVMLCTVTGNIKHKVIILVTMYIQL